MPEIPAAAPAATGEEYRPTACVFKAGRMQPEFEAAVRRGGMLPLADPLNADAIIWCSPDPGGLAEVLEKAPSAAWVQLPYAGIESFVEMMTPARTFTCAKGIYGPAVAEMTLGMLIAAFRRIDRYARATSWEPLEQRRLSGSHVLVLGGGGIGSEIVSMLAPLGVRLTVVRPSARPIEGAEVVGLEALRPALGTADAVVLAQPLTTETRGLVDGAFLGSMKATAWLVNVARGGIVVTDDLVQALREDTIAGAFLDVTDPEPLPAGHALWGLSNCVVTPHVANTPALGDAPLLGLIEENCRRFAAGEPLAGLVDQEAGY